MTHQQTPLLSLLLLMGCCTALGWLVAGLILGWETVAMPIKASSVLVGVGDSLLIGLLFKGVRDFDFAYEKPKNNKEHENADSNNSNPKNLSV